MSHWNHQNMDVLQQQAVQRLVAAELELIAAKAVLSEIEQILVSDHLISQCNVLVGRGTCIFDIHTQSPKDVVIEKIHPIRNQDHVTIEFRAFTTKGKPCKQTSRISFNYLSCFKKKT